MFQTLATSHKSEKNLQTQLTLSLEAPRASHSRLRVKEPDWTTRVATSPWSLSDFAIEYVRDGYSGKMFLGCFQSTEEKLLPRSFKRWANAGISAHGEFLTLKTSESHNGAVAC